MVHDSEEKMATCVGYETDNSGSEAGRPTSASNAKISTVQGT